MFLHVPTQHHSQLTDLSPRGYDTRSGCQLPVLDGSCLVSHRGVDVCGEGFLGDALRETHHLHEVSHLHLGE